MRFEEWNQTFLSVIHRRRIRGCRISVKRDWYGGYGKHGVGEQKKLKGFMRYVKEWSPGNMYDKRVRRLFTED